MLIFKSISHNSMKSLKFFILLAYNSEILSIFAIEIVIKV